MYYREDGTGEERVVTQDLRYLYVVVNDLDGLVVLDVSDLDAIDLDDVVANLDLTGCVGAAARDDDAEPLEKWFAMIFMQRPWLLSKVTSRV